MPENSHRPWMLRAVDHPAEFPREAVPADVMHDPWGGWRVTAPGGVAYTIGGEPITTYSADFVPEPEAGSAAKQHLDCARREVETLKRRLAHQGGFDVRLLK